MKAHRVIRARAVWTPSGWLEDGAVVLGRDDRTIQEVRHGRASDGSAHEGLLIPGLINAHLHLELGGLRETLPRGGVGFDAWANALIEARKTDLPEVDREDVLAESARDVRGYGTAVVSDISNRGDTASALCDARLRGVVQHEVMGFEPTPTHWEKAHQEGKKETGVVTRPAAHAPYSTHPDIIRATSGERLGAPSSIHLAEDEAERDFLMSGAGTFADFLDGLGVPWRHVAVPGCDPVAYLDRLDVLGPGQLLVHGVDLLPEEQRLVARSGSPLCICARSNLWIGGVLPDVPGLLDAGVTLCLGTDSLASCDSLDVLEEIPVLADAFPDIPGETWLGMATAGGAAALGIPWGNIRQGVAPGLVLLHDVGVLTDLMRQAPSSRTWLAEPGPCPWPSEVSA